MESSSGRFDLVLQPDRVPFPGPGRGGVGRCPRRGGDRGGGGAGAGDARRGGGGVVVRTRVGGGPHVRAREGGSRGIDGQSRIASHLAVVDGLAIGDRRLPAVEVKIADLGIFDVVGMGDGPAMLVGVDALPACPVRIAYRTGRLHICP